mgnify:FL=1
MVTGVKTGRWRTLLFGLVALAVVVAPALAHATVDVATGASTCPTPTKMGISANPGASCVTGVGTGTVTFWLWTGAAWSQQFILIDPTGATTAAVSVIAGCLAAVIPGIAVGQSPLPSCNGGDHVSSVQRPNSLLTPPGAGFVTERWRPSRFNGQGYCEKVAIGGQSAAEVVIAGGAGQAPIPC